MTVPVKFQADALSIGRGTANGNIVVQQRAPATSDWNYSIGTVWLDQVNVAEYTLLSVSSSQGINSATWLPSGGGSSGVATINSLVPSGGNIDIVGTSNEISVANAGSTVTLSVPATFIAPGSIEATTTVTGTTVTASTGNVTATAGKLVAGGDEAGAASTTSISNVVNTTQGAGTLSILSTTDNPGNNTGFLKFYVGTTAVFVPYFVTIDP